MCIRDRGGGRKPNRINGIHAGQTPDGNPLPSLCPESWVKAGETLYAFGALIEIRDLSPQCRHPYVESVLDPVELVGVDVVLADLFGKDAVHQFELCDEHRNLEPWVAFDG